MQTLSLGDRALVQDRPVIGHAPPVSGWGTVVDLLDREGGLVTLLLDEEIPMLSPWDNCAEMLREDVEAFVARVERGPVLDRLVNLARAHRHSEALNGWDSETTHAVANAFFDVCDESGWMHQQDVGFQRFALRATGSEVIDEALVRVTAHVAGRQSEPARSVVCIGGVTWRGLVYLDGEPTRLVAHHRGVWWTLEETKRGRCVLSFEHHLRLSSGKTAPMCVIVSNVRGGRGLFTEAFAVVSNISADDVGRLAAIEEARIGAALREAHADG